MTKEKLVGHIMPKTTPIISCEMQTSEALKRTSNLQKKIRKKDVNYKCRLT
jgi:hypothetical protein